MRRLKVSIYLTIFVLFSSCQVHSDFIEARLAGMRLQSVSLDEFLPNTSANQSVILKSSISTAESVLLVKVLSTTSDQNYLLLVNKNLELLRRFEPSQLRWDPDGLGSMPELSLNWDLPLFSFEWPLTNFLVLGTDDATNSQIFFLSSDENYRIRRAADLPDTISLNQGPEGALRVSPLSGALNFRSYNDSAILTSTSDFVTASTILDTTKTWSNYSWYRSIQTSTGTLHCIIVLPQKTTNDEQNIPQLVVSSGSTTLTSELANSNTWTLQAKLNIYLEGTEYYTDEEIISSFSIQTTGILFAPRSGSHIFYDFEGKLQSVFDPGLDLITTIPDNSDFWYAYDENTGRLARYAGWWL